MASGELGLENLRRALDGFRALLDVTLEDYGDVVPSSHRRPQHLQPRVSAGRDPGHPDPVASPPANHASDRRAAFVRAVVFDFVDATKGG